LVGRTDVDHTRPNLLSIMATETRHTHKGDTA